MELGLDPAVHAFGRHLAAAAGALSALISLLGDASVPTACLRGGGALLAVLVTFRLGTWALERALALDALAAAAASEASESARSEEEDPQR